MWILDSLIINNFLSHSKTELSFKDGQKLLIDGKSGSGKSSISEGLVWCLYGKGRSDNKSLIKKGKSGAKVITILYNNDKKIYCKIERSITKSNKHSISVFEGESKDNFKPAKATGVKGVQEYLEKNILKSSYLLFINSIVYLQENTETFVKQPASKRKDLLLEIINSDNYDEYLKNSKKAIQETKTNISVNESKLEEKERQISIDKERSSNITIYKEQKEKIATELKDIRTSLSKTQEDYDSLILKISQINNKEESIIEIKKRIDLNNYRVAELNNKIISYQTIDIKKLEEDVSQKNLLEDILKKEQDKKSKAVEWQMKMNDATRLLPIEHNYDVDIESVNKRIINILGESVPECKKCGTKYPEFEESKQKRIKELEDQLIVINEKKKEYLLSKDKYNEAVLSLGECPKYDQNKIESCVNSINLLLPSVEKLNSISGNVEIIKNIESDIGKIKIDTESLKTQEATLSLEISGKDVLAKEMEEKKLLRTSLIAKEQTLTSNNAENESRLALAEDSYNNLIRNEKEVKKIKDELSSLKKDNNSLTLIKDAFSPNGIKAIVIDYVIPQLEDKINNVLSKLSDFRIKLETQKSGATEGSVLEGLFITVINDIGEELQFDSYSGGERLKIIVSISEALAEIQTIGFRILDELFVGLDNESTESFTNVMMELQDRFSQMVCISHIQNIKDIFDEKILVVKNNGDSSIK